MPGFSKTLILGIAVTSLFLVTSIVFASGQKKLDAGPDMTVSISDTVTLRGSVNDPEPPYLSIGWIHSVGPGEAEFDNQHSATTNVAFSQPGRYVLALGGYDGDVAYDEVVVTVKP